MEINQKLYDELAEFIQSDTSPVGIDAKKTHIIILAKLMKIEERLANLEKEISSIKKQENEN